MNTPHRDSPHQVAIGLRAFKGGAVVIALASVKNHPQILLSTLLTTHTVGNRLSLEPYGYAAAMVHDTPRPTLAEMAAAVTEGRTCQAKLAENGLCNIIQRLQALGYKPTIAALLVNRAGWVTDLLEYSLAWPDHVPVAEGLAVREALRTAIVHCQLAMIEVDEKSLPDMTEQALGLSAVEIGSCLKALGATAGKPWRKEQKLACLAAWIALKSRQ